MTRRAPARSAAERLERSARFWMHAYPRRWRRAFGDDFLGVLAEVSGPEMVRVPARESLAIVMSGWALRLREHPPLLRWLGYRFLDRRLPPLYAHWVADDVVGMLWFVRYTAGGWITWSTVMWFGVAHQQIDEMARLMIYGAVGAGFGSLLLIGQLGRSKRRAAWQRHISPEVPLSLLSRRDQARVRLDEQGA